MHTTANLKETLDDLRARDARATECGICPCCGGPYDRRRPALSRVYKGVSICSACGLLEAFGATWSLAAGGDA